MTDNTPANTNSTLANFDFNSLLATVGNSVNGGMIPLADGNMIALPDGFDMEDLFPAKLSGNNDPIWVFKAGQPKNRENPEFANKFYGVKSVKDDVTGKYSPEFIGPFDSKMLVYPVGFRRAQIYMPPYNENASQEDKRPICKSNDAIRPNQIHVYNNTAPSQYCRVLTQNGLKEVCPALKWGTKNPQTGKATPPSCAEQIFLVFAFQFGEEMQVGEISFQKGGIKYGNALIPLLKKQVKDQNLLIYTHPIELTIVDAGNGNVPCCRLLTEITPDFTEDDHGGFLQAIERFNAQREYLSKQATYVPQDSQATQDDPEPEIEPAKAVSNVTKSATKKTASKPVQDEPLI